MNFISESGFWPLGGGCCCDRRPAGLGVARVAGAGGGGSSTRPDGMVVKGVTRFVFTRRRAVVNGAYSHMVRLCWIRGDQTTVHVIIRK